MPSPIYRNAFFPAIIYLIGALAGRYLPEPALLISAVVILACLILALGIFLGLYLYRRHDSTPR